MSLVSIERESSIFCSASRDDDWDFIGRLLIPYIKIVFEN